MTVKVKSNIYVGPVNIIQNFWHWYVSVFISHVNFYYSFLSL